MAFEGLTEKLSLAFKKLRSKGKLSEADIKEAMRDVRIALLEADADVARILAQQALIPHRAGMSDQQLLTFDQGLLTLPGIQDNRRVNTDMGLAFALKNAENNRHEALLALSKLTVMYDDAVRQQ